MFSITEPQTIQICVCGCNKRNKSLSNVSSISYTSHSRYYQNSLDLKYIQQWERSPTELCRRGEWKGTDLREVSTEAGSSGVRGEGGGPLARLTLLGGG